MDVSRQTIATIWIPLLWLIGTLLTGCAGASSSTTEHTDSNRLFYVPPEKRAEYDPSDIPYDTVYTRRQVDITPSVKGGANELFEQVDYPDRAREEEITGRVLVGFIVSPDGRPTHAQVVDPAHVLLNKAALQTIEEIRYTPGKLEGKPVPVMRFIPITYKTKASPFARP